MEILGAKDSWVDKTGKSTKWPYHYHERLSSYPGADSRIQIDQIEEIIKKIAAKPWERRHNIITWVPERDLKSDDPPCLQRVWFFPSPNEDGSYSLNMNYNFRSRNVMIASPMNMIGLYALQCYVRDEVKKRSGMNLKNGRIVDFIDSFHVSAQDQHILKNFMPRLNQSLKKGKTIEDRSFTREYIFGEMNYLIPEIEAKIIVQTEKEFEERYPDKTERYRLFELEKEKIHQIAESRRRQIGA